MNRGRTDTKIANSIAQLYYEAGIDLNNAVNPITPLHQLIEAYSLRIEELPDLTYKSAKRFLEQETRTEAIMEHSERELAGFLYARHVRGHDYGCILVRINDPLTRRRFTVAHELGHYLLHFRQIGGSSTDDLIILSEGLNYNDAIRPSDTEELALGELEYTRGATTERPQNEELQKMEREANQFAAELLMPANKCHKLYELFSNRLSNKAPVLISKLAGELLVGYEAMAWRMKNLGLIFLS